MIKIHRGTPPVVATCLGFFMALGIPETSLAQALHRRASEDQNRGAVGSSVAPGAEEGADLTLRLALFDTVGLDPAVIATTKERVEGTFLQIDVAIAPAQEFQRSPAKHTENDGQKRTAPEEAPTGWKDRVLDVAYFSSAQLSGEVRAAMVGEVERVFAEIGFQVRTHAADELTGPGGPDPATLLRLVIREQSARSWGINPAALGAKIGRQVPPTAVHLFASPIRRVLGIANKPDGYLSAESVGRAFARVAVHEIVHAYAPDHPHSGWGITGHAQDARSLTQAGLMLDERAARAFAEGWHQIMSARQQIVQR